MSSISKTTGRIMLFTTGACAAILMAACGNSGQTAANSQSTSAASTKPAYSANTALTDHPQTLSHSQPAAMGADTARANADSAATPECHTTDLSFRIGDTEPGPSASQHILMLDYTNKSSHSCYLDGYGGVDMIGPPVSDLGGTYQIRRSSSSAPQRLVLAPGASAHTELTYLTFENGDIGSDNSGPWTPTQLEVTPPNETTHFTVSWTPNAPIIRQDTATAPGSYISPVLPGQ